ncbi:MAG: TPM domain-containing protein, partial [Lachnospiraceae bacterium]|nr:TPM domain-containing protein [Lachnospiraceae bacterium]
MRNKKSISLLSLIAAVFTVVTMAALPVRAADSFFVYNNPQTGYSVYIDDDQDLLTDAEEQSLIEEMIPITEYGNVGFISCDNTSESTASYSARRYSSLFGSDSGAVLVIDMGQRMIYIKNNGAVSKIITNA